MDGEGGDRRRDLSEAKVSAHDNDAKRLGFGNPNAKTFLLQLRFSPTVQPRAFALRCVTHNSVLLVVHPSATPKPTSKHCVTSVLA